MPRKWITTPLPYQGSGGEQADAAPGLMEPGRARLVRNAVIDGPGIIGQVPDWLKGDTCKNLAGTPVEGHAVCGIFPFAQQGGASANSAGVAFSFNGDDNKIYLHQLGELVTILRTLEVYASFTDALPPQMTGFEMFGKFYVVPYRPNEGVGLRKGLGVFDPAGAGTFTVPTFVLGGGAATALRFRGIANHRGATILGWGYFTEADQDQAHVLRFCKYGAPDTWVPDATDTTAGFINVGTLKIPIVACAMSGQYTIIGKESEIFALDGDFSAQFYYRTIGGAHGPVSTVGMVSIGDAAVWIASKGPAMSVNGQPVELLAIDRVVRRFLSYMDLTTCWGVHDPERNRVVWGLRRKTDDDGDPVTSQFLTELFWWDYQRHAFGTHSLPSPIFSVGLIRGPGTNVPGPSGVVSNLAASSITLSSALISWTAGDTAADVTFEVEYKITGQSTWVPGGTTPPAVTSKSLTGLASGTHYDVRVRQVRNGQVSAYVQALDLFTTVTAAATPAPTGVAAALGGDCYCQGGTRYEQVKVTWTPFTAPSTLVRLYRSGVNDFELANLVDSDAPTTGVGYDSPYPQVGTTKYYWVRTEATDGSGNKSVEVPTGGFLVSSSGGNCSGTCGGGGGPQ